MLSKSTAAHTPPARSTGKGECERRIFVGIEAFTEADLACAFTKQLVDRLAEQMFAGAICGR